MTTTQMLSNDLWSLYAQTVVRFDYYASEKYYSESHQLANFERDGNTKLPFFICKIANQIFIVARQRKILHPDIKESSSLRMFESEDHEMYFPRSLNSNLLNGERFCEFHNSPRFNPLQMDLWQRIQRAIDSTLSMDDQVDLRSPAGQYLLKKYLEEMSQVLKTNHIPLFEPEDFGPEMVGPVPVDTPCPGK